MYGLLKLKFHCLFGGTLQVLSMSRLGGAAAVAPLVAEMSPEVFNEKNFHILIRKQKKHTYTVDSKGLLRLPLFFLLYKWSIML